MTDFYIKIIFSKNLVDKNNSFALKIKIKFFNQISRRRFLMTVETKSATNKTSQQEQLQLPAQLPDIIERIERLKTLLLETSSLEEARSTGRELVNDVNFLTQAYEELYNKAKSVSEATAPYFKKVTKKNRQAFNAIKDLNQLTQGGFPEINNPGISVYPDFLPKIQDLSTNFSNLHRNLKDAMTQAQDPDNPLSQDQLEDAYNEYSSLFSELSTKQEDIFAPLTEKTQILDEHVETTRQQKANTLIAKAGCKWLLDYGEIYTRVYKPLRRLQEEIGAIYNLNELIKNQLKSDSYDDTDRIKTKFELIFMGDQTKTIDSIEEEIRSLADNYSEFADPEKKNTLLHRLQSSPKSTIADAKEDISNMLALLPRSFVDLPIQNYRAVIKRFNDCKNDAGSLTQGVRDAIAKLDLSIKNNGKELTEIVESIPLHDETIEKGVNAHLMQTVQDMKTQKKEIKTMIENSWEQILKNLTLRNKNLTFNEIYRVGYWMLDNGGVPPRDITSTWYGLGWKPSLDYVTPLVLSKNEENND